MLGEQSGAHIASTPREPALPSSLRSPSGARCCKFPGGSRRGQGTSSGRREAVAAHGPSLCPDPAGAVGRRRGRATPEGHFPEAAGPGPGRKWKDEVCSRSGDVPSLLAFPCRNVIRNASSQVTQCCRSSLLLVHLPSDLRPPDLSLHPQHVQRPFHHPTFLSCSAAWGPLPLPLS